MRQGMLGFTLYRASISFLLQIRYEVVSLDGNVDEKIVVDASPLIEELEKKK